MYVVVIEKNRPFSLTLRAEATFSRCELACEK